MLPNEFLPGQRDILLKLRADIRVYHFIEKSEARDNLVKRKFIYGAYIDGKRCYRLTDFGYDIIRMLKLS
jgi:hypothetical protein